MAPSLVLLAPTVAAAQDAGPDTVVLHDGGMLKGNLIEVLPGDHATLQLANGQSARIRWDVIDHIIRNGVPLNTTQAQQQPATPPASTPAPVETGRVWVHIEGGDGVDLESIITNATPTGKRVTNGWATMCTAPCDQEVPLAGSYRLAGAGIRASHTFKLAGKPGDKVYIQADPASKGSFVGGIVLISVGAPVLVIGTFVELVVGLINAASRVDNSYTDTSGAQVVGLSMMGLGVAGIITGIVLVAGNGSTKLDQTIASPGAPKAAAAIGADVFKKMPVYHLGEGPTLPPLHSVPLFTGSF
ncbi:MAG: hypothetical protein ABI551_08515 [Polyangiaceae bacterium]